MFTSKLTFFQAILLLIVPIYVTSQNWDAFKESLDDSTLHGPIPQTDYLQCFINGSRVGRSVFHPSDPDDEAGICMRYYSCGYQFCDPDNYGYNLPIYAMEAKSEEDIVKAVDFARKNGIEISVKTSGYSLQGSSTKENSLLISMKNFPKDGEVIDKYSGKVWI